MNIVFTVMMFLAAAYGLLSVPRELRKGKRRSALVLLLAGTGGVVMGISGCYFIAGYASQPSGTLLLVGGLVVGIAIFLSQRWIGKM